jgi:AcrR family transcriptional regulator
MKETRRLAGSRPRADVSAAVRNGRQGGGGMGLSYDAPMPRRQAERSDTTRRAILDAARDLMADQGYEHTRIEQIAERAGVSKGALYYHYRDKVEVLAAVYEDLARQVTERLVRATKPGADPIDALRAGSRLFLDACADPAYRQIALIDAPAGLGWDRWRQIDLDAGGCGLLHHGLQAAADAGVISPDHLEERAHLLLAQLTEGALLVGRSDHPKKTRAAMTALIDEQLEALRRSTH